MSSRLFAHASIAGLPCRDGPEPARDRPAPRALRRYSASILRTNTYGWLFVSCGTRLPAWVEKVTNRQSAEISGNALLFFACAPLEARLARKVELVARSRTNTSVRPLVSSATRFPAWDRKATRRPSAEIDGEELDPDPWPPAEETLTSSVVPAFTSRTNTSNSWLVSPATRLWANEVKATTLPASEITGWLLSSLPVPPPRATLTRIVFPVCLSRRKTSPLPFVSPPTMSGASDEKTSHRPSGVMSAWDTSPSPGLPPWVTSSTVVTPAATSRTKRW